ncbi:CoA pyrophosphatase [Cochlodiniinecator piscidefendens]|uniref:CoA pyrophosphatase n=1 Tax=Cochlodiniinecator piscidefendens TaxID=2715756 RepID=UPI00140892D6|nr:CoA pyrophosphatase [Cochlodiniinecator piscidefendens]
MTKVDLEQKLRTALEKSGAASSDFDLNPELVLPDDRILRPAAVLVAVQVVDDKAEVILTKRASHLKHHPGQIAFPGGKQDKADSGPIDTALREAEEEIGLRRENVQVLGTLPMHETVTGFNVTPVLALVSDTEGLRPEPGEVAEIFSVPIGHLFCAEQYKVQSRYWRRSRRYYYTVPYGPYYIWGATARILRSLAEQYR